MRIGAHVSVAGSLERAVDRAVEMGCECLQIFVGNPRQWRAVRRSAAEKRAFRARREGAGLEPLVAHSSYLINLASPDPEARERSTQALADALDGIVELGGLGVVTHIGSRRDQPLELAIARVARSILTVLERAPAGELILENSPGGSLGGDFAELAAILEALDGHPRVRVCLDTAHLFGFGWDLRQAAGVKRALAEFDRVVGLERLRLFHLNDSRADPGSRRDRHENIGEGSIGAQCFRALLRDRRLADRAGILEVPGYDGNGPDRRNVEALRALRSPVRAPKAAPKAKRARAVRRP